MKENRKKVMTGGRKKQKRKEGNNYLNVPLFKIDPWQLLFCSVLLQLFIQMEAELFIPTRFCLTCVGWLKPIHLSGKLQTNLLICLWLTWVIFIYDPLVKYIQTSNPTLREWWRITLPSSGESPNVWRRKAWWQAPFKVKSTGRVIWNRAGWQECTGRGARRSHL